MRKALEDLLERYTQVVNTDAGFWDPETEAVVIAARAALLATPSRESSDELAALAARYLGMSEDDFGSAVGNQHGVPRIDVFTDIKRLAGSVLSQAGGGGVEWDDEVDEVAADMLEALVWCSRVLPRYQMAGKTPSDDEELGYVLESVLEAIAKAAPPSIPTEKDTR